MTAIYLLEALQVERSAAVFPFCYVGSFQVLNDTQSVLFRVKLAQSTQAFLLHCY